MPARPLAFRISSRWRKRALAQPAAPQQFKGLGNAPVTAAEPLSLRPFFTQWLRSTGVPEFTLEYVTYRTKKGFRIVGKAKQDLDFFRMDVEIEVQTEGNPEFKTINISGKESSFTVETFGRPKPNGIILDPHNYILKSSQRLRVRGIIARGEIARRAGPLLRRRAAISARARTGPHQCPGGLPHGRGILLPEKLCRLGAILPRRARCRHRSRRRGGPKCGRTSTWEEFTTFRATARAPSTNTARPNRPRTIPAALRRKRKNP